MFNFVRNHKAISALICLNIVAIILVTTIIIIHHAKTATVSINVAPEQATITLNGREYENSQSYDLLPGNYHVRISMDGMQAKEYDITLDTNDFARIWTYLVDASGGFNYYLSHPQDFNILTEVAADDDQAAQDFITEYHQKISFQDLLPIDYDAYTDDYAYYTQYHIYYDYDNDNCPKILCLIIEDNTGGNEQAAKDKIKELGYNPDDYNLDYQYTPIYGSELGNE